VEVRSPVLGSISHLFLQYDSRLTKGHPGGKHFSRDLRPVDSEGNEISMWADGAKKRDGEDEDEEDDSDEEDSEEGAGPSATANLSREERKREKKARKEAAMAKSQGKAVQVGDLPSDSEEDSEDEDQFLSNPNHSTASRKQAAVAPTTVEAATEGVKDLQVSGTPSRRERESMEAAQAKERYRRLHESGKTDEAKADLARLRVIREKREAEAARKVVSCLLSLQVAKLLGCFVSWMMLTPTAQAEKEEKDALAREKRAEIETKEAKKRAAALGPQKGKGKK
jgi:hypothetical protein